MKKLCNRSGARESAGRSVHQWPSAAQPHPFEDRRTGGGRRPSVRHLAPVARVPRLRLQDPQPLPGDGQHPSRSVGRDEAEAEPPSGHPTSYPGLPYGEPGHLFVGSARQVRNSLRYGPSMQYIRNGPIKITTMACVLWHIHFISK